MSFGPALHSVSSFAGGGDGRVGVGTVAGCAHSSAGGRSGQEGGSLNGG